MEAAGADRVLLGTDYPFDMGVDDPIERVREAALAEADERAILSGNAAELLGARLPSRAAMSAASTAAAASVGGTA